jgi:predicted nucleotidyltransferase component of viral defense system
VISREEILKAAREQGLTPNVVEKDYVLGWLLAGIAQQPLLSGWVFKGGTCLKKCFFETYRFSEDLDFTVPKGFIYDANAYRGALVECAERISTETGIELLESGIEVRESHDKEGRTTFFGKISYRGPLMPQASTPPRIKIDLTQHEVIVESPEKRPVRHFYSDAPNPPFSILCYTVNEILAEKTRALFERQARARDVYDVVNMSRNHREEIDPQKALAALRKKFEFKALTLPSLDGFIRALDFTTLEANWDQQLRHQLPALPPAQSYFDELKEGALLWIEARVIVERLPRVTVGEGEVAVPRAAFPQMELAKFGRAALSGGGSFGSYAALEKIRYAARNRLCAEIQYHGVLRIAEPYALRTRGTGNLLLYVHEISRGGVRTETTKAYMVAQIRGVRITESEFHPRYTVEL